MRIELVGKVHRSGVSKKSGNPYDFIELHVVLPKRGVIGKAAQTVTTDAAVCPFDQLIPGVYDAEFDNNGNLLSLVPVQIQAPVTK